MFSDFANYILNHLPDDYLLGQDDRDWLNVCALYHSGDLDNNSVLETTKKAVDRHNVKIHIDPYELLIDAGICDPELNPISEKNDN